MKNVIKIHLLLSLFLVIPSCKNHNSLNGEQVRNKLEFPHRIPAGENSWDSGEIEKEDEMIGASGIRNWTDTRVSIDSYFRLATAGELKLGLKLKVQEPTDLKITLNGESREITIENRSFKDIAVGVFSVENSGYQNLKISRLDNDSNKEIEIEEILLGGAATEGKINFVEDNFHFGRRGPSVHLRYQLPEEKDIVWFYNEIEVPEGEDVIGSYFMANGFSHGYFGIQVNSDTERRILFSVWSPYETQNPEEIPEGYQIQLLDKGKNVVTGKFGNEGSGGQSYKKFNWKTGTTYGFLLKGEPNNDGTTDFTAYFHAPEVGQWRLIASFRRPHTDTYLGDLYSFLENFVPSTGDTTRKAFYKNQWVYDTTGEWTEINKAEFTADATAIAGHRLDYAGGIGEKGFYLRDCGFFDNYTKMGTDLERKAGRISPDIDFSALPGGNSSL